MRLKNRTIHRLLTIWAAAAIATCIGCKDPATAQETSTTETATPTNNGAQTATLEASRKTNHTTMPSDEKKPVPDGEPSPSTVLKTSEAIEPKPKNTPEKPLRTVCVRSCNKLQICGKSTGSSAAECMQKCLTLSESPSDETRHTLESFRSQEACADVKCDDFERCVQTELARRRQLDPVPAFTPEKAQATCKSLCEHEKECKPEIFSQLRKNMTVCIRYCSAVLVGTDNASGAARTIMNEAIQCLGTSCEVFETCVQKGR